jgi:hypothetical protein
MPNPDAHPLDVLPLTAVGGGPPRPLADRRSDRIRSQSVGMHGSDDHNHHAADYQESG